MSLAVSGYRGAVCAAVAVTAALGGAVLPVSAARAESGRCAAGTGVTVVVDYASLGRGVETGCDPDGAGQRASDVVPAAGFPLTYVNGEAFVCRIDGLPDSSQESCARTPPEDAYWGLYWSDGKSKTWKYSSEGAGSLEVPEGGSIGWRFQDGGAREVPSAPPTTETANASPTPHPTKSPSSAPPAPSNSAQPTTPTPTPTPSASVPPGTKGSNPSPSKDAKPGSKDDKQPRDKQKSQHDKKKQDKKKRHQTAAPAATLAPSPTVALSPASGEPTKDEGSSPALTLVAGGAVLLLAGAAGAIAWRRRA